MQNSKLQVKIKKYLPLIILVIILLIGAFFRLYKISEYMTFLGDEGRDVLVVKRIIVDHKFTLLGPITSVGSMYMGPIYYYFMVPFLWLWRLDPVGPSVMVAILAVATIFLIYKLGADFFHKSVGLVSAFFYAVSPLPITSGRSSWNPNVVPFFAVLLIYSLLEAIVKKKYHWFIVSALSLGILLQLHYVTLIFVPIIFVCLLLIRFRVPTKYYLASLAGLLISYSPFLLFELRHQFVNLHAVFRFFLKQQSSLLPSSFIVQFLSVISDVFVRLFWRLLIVDSAEVAKLFIFLLAGSLILYYKKYAKKEEERRALKVILIWLGIGLTSFGIYRGVIYDYYLGSLFAIPFILSGLLFYTLWQQSSFTKLISALIFILISFFIFKNSPLLTSPSNLLKNTREIAEFVWRKKGDKLYNFALIAGRNSDHAYRYFLEIWGEPPVVIENPTNDPLRQTVTGQLFVVCEEKVCQPLGHPLWEIAGFGRAEIAGQWQVSTAQVFKLVPYNK